MRKSKKCSITTLLCKTITSLLYMLTFRMTVFFHRYVAVNLVSIFAAISIGWPQHCDWYRRPRDPNQSPPKVVCSLVVCCKSLRVLLWSSTGAAPPSSAFLALQQGWSHYPWPGAQWEASSPSESTGYAFVATPTTRNSSLWVNRMIRDAATIHSILRQRSKRVDEQKLLRLNKDEEKNLLALELEYQSK